MADSNANITRNELLIVLEYLVNHTDEHHIPFQDTIVNYARDEYGIDIRRQRVGPILNYLYNVCSKYPDRFPFILESVSTGQKTKYYIQQRFLSEDDVLTIGYALKAQHSLHAKEIAELIEKIVIQNSSIYERKKLLSLVDLSTGSLNQLATTTYDKLRKLRRAKENKEIVEFQLSSLLKTIAPRHIELEEHNTVFRAYVHDILEFEYNPYVILVNVATHQIESHPISKMKILGIYSMFDNPNKAPNTDQVFQSETHDTVNSYLKDAVLPLAQGNILEIKFQFIDNEYDFDTIHQSFVSYFKQPMHYVKEEVVTEFSVENRNIKLVYVHVRLSVNSRVFLKWASQFDIARVIEVNSPSTVVRQLITHYTFAISKSRKNDDQFEHRIIKKRKQNL